MTPRSGLLQAGEILQLVGAIVSAFGALFLLGMVAFFATVFTDAEADVVGTVYIGMGVVLAVGAVLGFVAWNKTRSGDLAAGFAFGLANALLPPVQIIPLLGAIFVKVCPEAQDA